MRFVIAAFPVLHLFDEAVALVDGIIQREGGAVSVLMMQAGGVDNVGNV